MKQPTQEQKALEQYATLAQRKILSSQADLGLKDQAMPEMLSWCREQQNIVVLQSLHHSNQRTHFPVGAGK